MNTDAPAPAATAARAIALAVLRHLITAAAMALVAHGYLDQVAARGAIEPLAEQLLGLLIAAASAGWSAIAARLSHGRWAAAWAALNGNAPLSDAAAGRAGSKSRNPA